MVAGHKGVADVVLISRETREMAGRKPRLVPSHQRSSVRKCAPVREPGPVLAFTFYSYRLVERYLSPPSGNIATTDLSLPSFAAFFRAT